MLTFIFYKHCLLNADFNETVETRYGVGGHFVKYHKLQFSNSIISYEFFSIFRRYFVWINIVYENNFKIFCGMQKNVKFLNIKLGSYVAELESIKCFFPRLLYNSVENPELVFNT